HLLRPPENEVDATIVVDDDDDDCDSDIEIVSITLLINNFVVAPFSQFLRFNACK
ncbi:unnamed protein product, partial [Rotaria sp. Silwood1]